MKVAISVPDPVFDAAERLAQELRVSRSHLYAQALATYLESRGAVAVTAKLNEVYSREPASVDPGLSKAQVASVGYEAW